MTDWSEEAKETFRKLASTGGDYTADDLIDLVGHPDDTHEANGTNSSIGSIFAWGHQQGLAEPTGRYVKSRQPRRKGGVIAVWRGTQGRLFDA